MQRGSTKKSAPASCAANASNSGISSRQGGHHVAQIFRSITRPAKSTRCRLVRASSRIGGESRGCGSSRSRKGGRASACRATSGETKPARTARRPIRMGIVSSQSKGPWPADLPRATAVFRPIRRTRSSYPWIGGACDGNAASTALLHLHPPRWSPCPWAAHAQCRAPHLQSGRHPC